MRVLELLWHRPLRRMDSGGVRKPAEVRPRHALHYHPNVVIIIISAKEMFT